MKSKKVIKFLIIGHNKFEKWVPFFIEGFKNNLDDLIFLFDNEIDDNLRKKLQNKNIKYFENEENIGKLNTLIKWSNEFNSDYVKIIDSDDSVIFNKIDIFIKAIENFVSYNNESHLLVHRGTVLKSNNYHYGLQSDDIYTISKQIYESTDLFWNLPPNAKNIYPTEVIKKLKGIDIVRQNYFNDDFLSLFTLLFTKNNVGYINEDIYIQFQANGQTSKITFERLKNFRIQYENLGRCVNKLKFMPEVPGKINLDKTIKMNQMWIDRYKENNHLSAEEETKLNNQFIEAVNTFFNLIKKRNALIIKNDLAEDTIIFIAKILKVINENSSYLVFDSELQSDKMKLLKEISLKMLNANFLLKKGKEYFYFSGEKFNDDFLKINYLDSDKIEVDEHCGSYVESILRNLKIELPQTLNKYICWDISSFSDLIIAQKSIWSFYEFNKNKEFIIFINYEIKLREKIIEFTNKLQKLRIKVVVRFIRNNYFLNSLEDIYKKNFYWLFNNFGFGKNDIMLRVENSVIFTDNILNNLFQKRDYDINTIYTVCNEGANSKIDGSIYLFSPFHIYYLVKSVLSDKDIDEVFSNEVKFPYSFLNELNIEDLSYISKYRIGQKDEDIKAPLFINYMKHKSYSYKGILSLLKINNEIFKNDLKKYIQGDKPKWTTLMQEAFDITNKLLSEQECERLDILEDINLTFIVTFYKTLNSDIEYWKNTYELFKAMNLDMHILVDDIDINDKFGWVASEDLFINTQNKGKLLSVYEHIKKGNVRTKHFKTIDPDDRISIVEIIKSKWLFDDDQIITMPSFRISGELPINQYEVENIVIKCDKIWFENFGTSWTILPTKLIKNDKYFDGTRIDINEDQILGQIAYSNGGRIKHLNRNWYIYKKEGGISNIDNFPSYIYNLKKTLKVNQDIKEKSGVILPTNWPGEFKYYLSLKKRYENIHGPLDQETHLIWNELLKYKEDPTKPLDSEEICRICMISDENQFDYALNSLFNISKRSSNPIESYLIVDKSNNKYEQKVKVINNYFEEHFKGKHTINLVDSSKKRIEIFESKIAHITWVTNLRIFITNILDKVEGKILYLDNDTYVDGDVSEIFRFAKNKRGHYGQQWSPKEPWPKKLSEITGKIINKYFNAGVLILDMDLLREMEFVKEATDFYRNFNPLIRYADQDILNSLLLINEFPSEFNIGRTKWVKQRRDLEGFYNLKIYHFLSYSKTWDTDEFNIKMIKQKESKGTLTLEEYEKFRPAREKWINEYNDYLSILKNKLPDSYKDSDYSISFLLTLFKPTDEQIMKWEDYEKKLIKLGIGLIILVDNPGLNLNNKFTKSKIYYNSENIGKFETVYNFIKNNEIKSTHIKVCDPDDNIIFEELEKFKINFPGILLLLNRINNNGCIDFKKQNSLGTGWTVIPVNPIKKDRFYIESDFKIRNWLEDQALGIICYINGAKFKRSNIGWYEYVLNLGMTKKIEEKDAKEIVETLDSLKKILNLSNEKPKTNFPGRLWYILNLIKHSDMSPNKKRNYREKIEEYIIYDGVEEIDCE